MAPIYRSFTDFFTVEQLRGMLGDGYLLQPNDGGQEQFRQAIDRFGPKAIPGTSCPRCAASWAKCIRTDGRSAGLRGRLPSRKASSPSISTRTWTRTRWTWARLPVCPDQVPDPEGRLIPACAYNLFYREKDPRFWQDSESEPV